MALVMESAEYLSHSVNGVNEAKVHRCLTCLLFALINILREKRINAN